MQTIDLKKLELEPNSKFLDLGCGEGRHCFGAYMSESIDVFGFDMSLSDVATAKKISINLMKTNLQKAVILEWLMQRSYHLKITPLIS